MKESSKKLEAKTLSMKIADKNRNEIIFGNYKEGERIIEQNLSKEFGVSRIPVREAIRLLESEGFLEISPYKGSVVREITPEAFRETHTVRLCIIPAMLEHALPNYTTKLIKQAEDLIDKTEKNMTLNNYLSFLLKIHDIMYGPCNMPFILHFAEITLKRHLMVLGIYYNSFLEGMQLDGYRKFFELCKEKKHKEALDYWMETLKYHYQSMADVFQKWTLDKKVTM